MDFMRATGHDSRSTGFSLDALLDFSHLEKHVQAHLTKVYSTLAMAFLICGASVYATLQGMVPSFLAGNLLTLLAVFGLMIWLFTTTPSPQNQEKRVGIFMGIAALMGINMTPLIDLVIQINPQIVFTALMVTSAIFISFSLASLLSGNGRQFLYLGGSLMSGLTTIAIVRLIGFLTGSQMAFDISLYLSLAVFCGFVLFDTQMIVYRRRMGDTDFVRHSLDLFIDAISIFKHIMVILTKKEDSRKRRN
jgi:FtsH-binding integral membrane protein